MVCLTIKTKTILNYNDNDIASSIIYHIGTVVAGSLTGDIATVLLMRQWMVAIDFSQDLPSPMYPEYYRQVFSLDRRQLAGHINTIHLLNACIYKRLRYALNK